MSAENSKVLSPSEKLNLLLSKVSYEASRGCINCIKYKDSLYKDAARIKSSREELNDAELYRMVGITDSLGLVSLDNYIDDDCIEGDLDNCLLLGSYEANTLLQHFLVSDKYKSNSVPYIYKYFSSDVDDIKCPILMDGTIHESDRPTKLRQIGLLTIDNYITLINAVLLCPFSDSDYRDFVDNIEVNLGIINDEISIINEDKGQVKGQVSEAQGKLSVSWFKRIVFKRILDSEDIDARLISPLSMNADSNKKRIVYYMDDLKGLRALSNPTPSFKGLLESTAQTKIWVGPRASGKTTGAIAYAFKFARDQVVGRDGIRRSRIAMFKKTESTLKTSLIPSVEETFQGMFKLINKDPLVGRLRCELASDGSIIECDIHFFSLSSVNFMDNIKGLQAGLTIIDEIDSIKDQGILTTISASTGRGYSNIIGGGVLGTCNGMATNSFLNQLIEDAIPITDDHGEINERIKYIEMRGRVTHSFHQQPPALLRPSFSPHSLDDWKDNPEAENIENLKGGYDFYVKLLPGSSDADIRSQVEGISYAPITGELIFPEFNSLHFRDHDYLVTYIENALTRDGGGFYMSFDFGKNPACLIGCLTNSDVLIIFKEIVPRVAINFKDFLSNEVNPYVYNELPFRKCLAVAMDPSGYTDDNVTDMTSKKVLERYGYPVTTHIKNNALGPRLQAVRDRATTLSGSMPKVVIDIKNCRLLHRALTSTYVYDDEGKPDKKNHNEYSHDIVDALQYMCMMLLKDIEKSPRRMSSFWVGRFNI